MERPLLSVIVPAYNNARWLPRCLDSILAQTYGNLEILVIDDGSGDNTMDVLLDYASRDSRVKPHHKENGGVTSARLLGVSLAEGEWIGFVDADDEIEPQMYEQLLSNAGAYGADISHCGYRVIYPDGRQEFQHGTGEFRRQDRITGLRDLLEERIVEPGLCSKLYRRSLFDGLSEKMDLSVRNNEDMLMNYWLFSRSECSVLEDVCPYHYLIREESASRGRLTANKVWDPIRVRQCILEVCPEEVRQDARRALLRMCLVVSGQLAQEKEPTLSKYRERIRAVIREHRASICLLSRRNSLLVAMLLKTPGLFYWLYPAYLRLRGQ